MVELIKELNLLFILLIALALAIVLIAVKIVTEHMAYKKYVQNRNEYLKETFKITEDIL